MAPRRAPAGPSALRCLLATAVAQGASAALTENEKDEVLRMHNVYRCMHGVPPLTWDDDLQTGAQAWAENGETDRHSKAGTEERPSGVGENLYLEYPSGTMRAAVNWWYSEISYTAPYGTATADDDRLVFRRTDPYNDAATQDTERDTIMVDIGHFTQVVWEDSQKLGCGKAKLNIDGCGSRGCDFIPCWYEPPGNFKGAYANQVKPPVKTYDECRMEQAPPVESKVDDLPPACAEGLPSSCTPNILLKEGSTCVYGCQCDSKFCHPRWKICMMEQQNNQGYPNGVILYPNMGAVAVVVPEGKRPMFKLAYGSSLTSGSVETQGGVCDDYLDGNGNVKAACRMEGGRLDFDRFKGQPSFPDQFDPSKCGCSESFMTHYREGTWIMRNIRLANKLDAGLDICGGSTANRDSGDALYSDNAKDGAAGAAPSTLRAIFLAMSGAVAAAAAAGPASSAMSA